MSIAKKIGFSIGGLTLLFAIVIVISIVAFEKANGGFTHYREFAKDSNLAGRVEAHLLQARINVKNYIKTGKAEDLERFEKDWKEMKQLLQEASREIQKPERSAFISDIVKDEVSYYQGFEQVRNLIHTRNNLVFETMDTVGPKVRTDLIEIMETAKRDNDMTAAYHAGMAAQHLLLGRLYAAKFLVDNSLETFGQSQEEFKALQASLATLDGELQNSQRRAALKGAKEGSDSYNAALHQVKDTILERNDIISNTLDKIGPRMTQSLEKTKYSVISGQDQLGPSLQSSLASSEFIVIIFGILSLLSSVAMG